MTGVRKRGEAIRQFILEQVEEYPTNISALTAQNFGITRQAVNKHIKQLVEQDVLIAEGTSRSKRYKLPQESCTHKTYFLKELEEDIVWVKDVAPLIESLPENALEIWNYGFTEILNNAIDHSNGTTVAIQLTQTTHRTEVVIADNGDGIFRKIKEALNLLDEHHAVLELSKGKLTTAPDRHSGQGIFFSSRMFDSFVIFSEGTVFSHQYLKLEEWISQKALFDKGTTVIMALKNSTLRTDKQIFDQYSAPVEEDYGFIKTVVPVRLVQYGKEQLVSRSQAKRLLARVDKFEVVVLDFEYIDRIGQAFSDEAFRVFSNQHPDIQLFAINTNIEINKMILRAGGQIRDAYQLR